MTQSQLVRINTPGDKKSPLSKAQNEFNRLTGKINDLENKLTDLRATASTIQQRIQTEYVPLLNKYNQLRGRLVHLFDRAYGHPDTTRSEKRKLADLVVAIAGPLLTEPNMDDLRPVFEKYGAADFDNADDKADMQVSEEMKAMVSALYGITFDENVDISTHEKFMAYVEEQRQARQTNDKKDKQEKPKSAKRQEREAKKQLEERNTTKAVRMLYMDLVKAFHPDRESDESEKARKTEIMQRVTEAYGKSDLLALLRLQLEYNRIDQTHLETLAEEQLRYYNNILKQQADELGQELFNLQTQLSTTLGKPFVAANSASGVEFAFNNDVRELKRSVKDMTQQVKDLSNLTYLKGWLKTYRT